MRKTIALLGVIIAALAPSFAIEVTDSAREYDRSAPIQLWQSYSASPVGVHEWMDDDAPYRIERLPDVSDDFRTGYAFVSHGKLIFMDMANEEQYRKAPDSSYIKEYIKTSYRRFSTSTHEFRFDIKKALIEACARYEKDSCAGIKIQDRSFPYVFAERNGAVLTVTNAGDALLFSNGRWCRMEMEHDVYECHSENIPALEKAREIQFYSSINYRGRTLVGEWPTGRIYEFDGKKLFPSDMTPPDIAGAGRVGYEAQSMAMYCGDLFVGYWPKGQIYRMDGKTKKWSLFADPFDEVSNGDFIPFLTRERKDGEKESAAFYGQRVTSLVPYKDSLYAVTSNLLSWSRDVKTTVLTDDQVKRYGAVYRILRNGCRTIYLDN